MSDKYFNEIVKSKNAKVFDLREEYDWWIENGCDHDTALKYAKSAEIHVLKLREERNGGDQDCRC